jgi:hypothetical protein
MGVLRVAVITYVVAALGTAAAQPAPSTPTPAPVDPHAHAVALFAEGRDLLTAHQPAQACDRFAQALALEVDDVGVMLNLGLCNEQLDKLATALKWFRRAQVRASLLQLTASEDAAKAKSAGLATTVPIVRIELPARPDGASVTVDGERVDEGDLGGLELDAGHHVLEARSPGLPPARAELDLVDGQHRVVELALKTPVVRVPEPPHVTVPAPRVAATVHAPPPSPRAPRRPAYAIGAVGGGLIVGSVALGLVGHYAAQATDHPDVQRQWQAAVRYGGTSMFVVGTAMVGWASWTFIRARRERATRTVVAPVAGGGTLGLAVSGAF